jgi:hypothetical protein
MVGSSHEALHRIFQKDPALPEFIRSASAFRPVVKRI